VTGEVDPTSIGSYRTMKTLSIRRQPVVVDLYPLKVEQQLDEWPEKGQRHRHWAILPEAKRLLSETKLKEAAARLSRSVMPAAQPATALMK
jgi:hypothetical protein